MSTERNRKNRVKSKARRQRNLGNADVNGWKQCSEYHFQKTIEGVLVNWYPSTRKIVILNETFLIDSIDAIYEIVKIVKSGEK